MYTDRLFNLTDFKECWFFVILKSWRKLKNIHFALLKLKKLDKTFAWMGDRNDDLWAEVKKNDLNLLPLVWIHWAEKGWSLALLKTEGALQSFRIEDHFVYFWKTWLSSKKRFSALAFATKARRILMWLWELLVCLIETVIVI